MVCGAQWRCEVNKLEIPSRSASRHLGIWAVRVQGFTGTIGWQGVFGSESKLRFGHFAHFMQRDGWRVFGALGHDWVGMLGWAWLSGRDIGGRDGVFHTFVRFVLFICRVMS